MLLVLWILLIKMNTGAGKTLVGLLMLYSKMLETNRKCLFLFLDKQLVSQVPIIITWNFQVQH